MYDESINRRIIREINTSTFFILKLKVCASYKKKNGMMVYGVRSLDQRTNQIAGNCCG